MPEPTIPEMLAWFDEVIVVSDRNDSHEMRTAIRAILEQHRDQGVALERIQRLQQLVNNRTELAAIRAFVERVEKRLIEEIGPHQLIGTVKDYRGAVMDELAAMESESNEPSTLSPH